MLLKETMSGTFKYFINYLKEVLFKLLLTLIITELENSDLPAASVLRVSMPTQI